MFSATARPALYLAHDDLEPRLRYADPPIARRRSAIPAFFVACIAAMLLSLLSDPAVSYLMQAYDVPRWLAHNNPSLLRIVRAPGQFMTYLPVLAVLCFVPRWRWRGSLLLASASAYAGLGTALLKWTVGRFRPFCDGLPNPHPFDFQLCVGGVRGLFNPPSDLCFPSGHTSLAFAAATALGMIFPQHRGAFWSIAVVTGLSRIAQGAHYTSDVIAGAAVGVAAAILSRQAVALLCNRLRQRSAQEASVVTQPS